MKRNWTSQVDLIAAAHVQYNLLSLESNPEHHAIAHFISFLKVLSFMLLIS